jgi:hypothetical protein
VALVYIDRKTLHKYSKRKFFCRTFPDREPEFEARGFTRENSSLLNQQGDVPGVRIALSEITSERLQEISMEPRRLLFLLQNYR